MTEANTPATGPQDCLEVAPTLPTSLPKDWLGRVRGLVSRGWPVWLVASLTLANGLLSMLRVLLDRFPDFPAFFTFLLPWGCTLGIAH
jgi:hypothetical protein